MSPTEESSKGAGCCVTIREELDLDGFPFDEQFGGAALLDEVCRTWYHNTTLSCMVARVRAEGALGDAVTVEKDESQRTPFSPRHGGTSPRPLPAPLLYRLRIGALPTAQSPLPHSGCQH